MTTQNETDTMDIYYASKDESHTTGFQLADLICATNKDCIIYCDINAGCENMEIQAQNAKSLYIECTFNSACSHNLRVFGPTNDSSEATIICNAPTSCNGGSNSFFQFNHTAIINIICTGSTQTSIGACTGLKIYAPSDDVKHVNITCGPYDCNSMELWTKPSALNAFLSCDGNESCTDAVITCINGNGKSTLSWNIGDNEWECDDESCCPLTVANPIITPPPFIPYGIIDCSSSQCENRYIDGSDLSSNFTVICDTESSCKYSKIICPTNAPCIVTCQAANACQDILIDASQSSHLHVKCSAQSACENADIYCTSDEDSCYIECGGSTSACNNMQILQITDTDNSYFAIKCPPSTLFANACNNIRFQCPSGAKDESILLWDGNTAEITIERIYGFKL